MNSVRSSFDSNNTFFLTIIFCFTLFIFQSCDEGPEATPPPNILPKEKMRDVIVGLNLADAIITSRQEKKDITKINVFKDCNVSSEQYYNSLSFYSSQPELLQEIYRDAIDSINRMKK